MKVKRRFEKIFTISEKAPYSVLNVKALVCAFNKEKVLVEY